MRDQTDDDDNDERPRRRARVVRVRAGDGPRRSLPRLLVFTLAAGGAAAVVVAVAVMGLVGREVVKAQQRADVIADAATAIAAKESKVFLRDEFRTIAIGKTPAQLLDLFGKPRKTSDNSNGTPDNWTYDNRSYDPVAQKADSLVILYFKDGIVARVHFI